VKTRRARGRFCVAVVLFAAAYACAVQTVEPVFAPAQEASAFDLAFCQTEALYTSESCMADVGRRMLDPAAYVHPLSAAADTQVVSLPAVPAAVFMTLFGFVCFSLASDRRAWLAVAGGLLWLGAAGVHAVPQLAHKIRWRSVRQTTENTSLSFSHIVALEPTGRDEQIGYIGLLHRLAAIPDHLGTISSVTNTPGRSAHAANGPVTQWAVRNAADWTNTQSECPVRATRHFVRFSPAFTFQNLVRGPPAVFL